ncbi:DarT ssDNA thymidine ADP-ribosyltransferase family protein [Bradyrhizobium sp. JYMT SZCCT0428]|uniref:DarT ssDNA thymidine ADP-ribosyltransferase family protein n=1 Tax=Bradyrhizobium sp. JYMT SZCCT0428 TaxID=2807673 RepID=UPI001BAAA119|nr:DarT ssDNA thymidine ADP-ribosyltransferase family protein [Bradyrhizobium sp. JYMT SZCCT0428]MBR1156074.1 DUF4433 domain-containing protein [Bradyrhizobium sp. JYMT SZCCT0428]
MDLDAFILRVRNSKQFDHFYHFTDKKNLATIKTDGLLCTSELRKLGRLEGITTGGDANSLASDITSGTDQFVCLCLTTNHPMCFRATERGLDPIYLSIDPDVIKLPGVMITNAPSNQGGVEKVAASIALDRLIHSSFIEHIDNKLDFVLFLAPPSKEDREKIMWNQVLKKNQKREPIEQLLFVSSEEGDPALISIRDMVQVSTKVADKVIETCSEQRIFLELDYRGSD